MKAERFEDLVVWQRSRRLVSSVYKETRVLKDFSFRDQIERATVSVMNNIAEGFERKGDKEFSKFLFISKGSCGELCSMLYLAEDLGYFSSDTAKRLSALSEEISKMLSSFITHLR